MVLGLDCGTGKLGLVTCESRMVGFRFDSWIWVFQFWSCLKLKCSCFAEVMHLLLQYPSN
ncbi:hypothetical protein MUK42_34001 [Musa troglodytarum]|uniref:Uncharacterized protein n=1 Tax=Musa troglodytarum TaxID=320322 RepID=A0A9E7JUQ1_9LILI|nr:hypothetical protein MUK42_34001 [Musa troglodytarum]